ncbi:MAG TPA: hypothetical protein VHA76_04855 [Solirubrobacterales bacterium]|nr:hypothetical protein [Solirubrobacterales bacterium]
MPFNPEETVRLEQGMRVAPPWLGHACGNAGYSFDFQPVGAGAPAAGAGA